LEKVSLFRGTNGEGRPLIHRIEPGTGYGLSETGDLSKTASHEHLPQVRELVESLAPQPGRLYLVNSAIGAGEFVGFNLRGDWFTERGLLHTPPGWDKIPVWDIDARRRAANTTEGVPGWGDQAWGYPTFYNAHRFRHHINKDPAKAYGFILGAFYDHRMHRVVLVSELVRDMCESLNALDIYERIEHGEFPDSSMGAKVPFDECSICGNKARNPAEYCKHVNNQDPLFGMNKILPDGRKCGVYNHHPRFFDDSFVFVGAERSAKVMSLVNDRVRGPNKYSQKIYPFQPAGVKVASIVPTQQQEDVSTMREAMRKIVERGEGTKVEDRLTQILDGIPQSNKIERAAAVAYARKARSKGAGDVAKEVDENFQSTYGQPLDHFSYLKSRIDGVEGFGAETKTAALSKWAEMLKNIPAPSASQISILRDHESRMPQLTTPLLRDLADRPDESLRGLAHLGIVLRPEEFQYMALCRQNPDAAEGYRGGGIVFRRSPIDMEQMPEFSTEPRPSSLTMDILRQVLGNLLAQRSFAPAAVRIRITRVLPAQRSDAFEHSDPVLDKISHAYNDYRGGLLFSRPSLRHLQLPEASDIFDLGQEVKLADASAELSSLLFHLAYWQNIPVG
jgi:hypothetical protein